MRAHKIINFFAFVFILSASVMVSVGQETPPAPGAPRPVSVPTVKEKKLPNGLTVAVVERKAVPLVTIQFLVRCGAGCEDSSKAGLADLTTSMLTKGTKTKTATQIAEAIEFLGGSIDSGAGWNSSFVTVTVTSDKVDQAMAILADVVLNPTFDEKEVDLLKTQTLDGLTYNLKQPSFLANYVASRYSFREHPPGGTSLSISGISRANIAEFYSTNFKPDQAVLIFTGDISPERAIAFSSKSFNRWKGKSFGRVSGSREDGNQAIVRRILVVDLPKSGQAAVTYAKKGLTFGRNDSQFYIASVLNSVLGGGYSSRLNYEIRIKRGLSYGAGSNFAWRSSNNNFLARVQTKDESAAEVASLIVVELKRLIDSSVGLGELVPRKSVLTGNFGRSLETTSGLANALADLYTFEIEAAELNSYVNKVNGVTDAQIKDFASKEIPGGDIIIVGDYSIFKDNLAKRFPGMKIEVIKADELDLSKDSLRK